MKLNKFAQLAAIGITVASSLSPLNAKAKECRNIAARGETSEHASDYAPKTDYSIYTNEEIEEAILDLEVILEELDEEQSALKKERKTLSLNIQAIQAELEFALDIVEKSLLQEELDALISLKDEQQNECKELHSEHRSIKKELRYLVELTNNETSVEEG